MLGPGLCAGARPGSVVSSTRVAVTLQLRGLSGGQPRGAVIARLGALALDQRGVLAVGAHRRVRCRGRGEEGTAEAIFAASVGAEECRIGVGALERRLEVQLRNLLARARRRGRPAPIRPRPPRMANLCRVDAAFAHAGQDLRLRRPHGGLDQGLAQFVGRGRVRCEDPRQGACGSSRRRVISRPLGLPQVAK